MGSCENREKDITASRLYGLYALSADFHYYY